MITRVVLLFLFGTTISSSHLISKLRSLPEISAIPSAQSRGCPTASELAPLICKLLQQNIDLYYKPKLIEPSTYVPPIVVEKCEKPELQMEIELPAPVIEKKPIVIPQPPELPPIMIPQFPVPMIIEDRPALAEPCETPSITERPALNIPAAPALPPIEIPTFPLIVEQPEPYYKRMKIPQPPELPTLTMPELPIIYAQEQPIIATPCFEDEKTPEVSATIQPLAPVPAAPELPAAIIPDYFPIHFDIPSGPVLPPINISSPPVIIEQNEPYLNEANPPEIDYNLVEYQPVSVPQPPELPAFVMPELPVIFADQELPTIAKPCLEDQSAPMVPIPEYIQSVLIPQPPELPAFVMPEFPVQLVEQEKPVAAAPYLDDQPAPIVPTPEYIQPVSIPQPPELPAFVMPEFPVQLVEQERPVAAAPCLNDQPAPIVPTPEYIQPVSIPQPPELPAFVMPEFPVQLVEQEKPVAGAPYLDDQPGPVVTIPEYIQPVSIPQPPELPAFVMPEFPVQLVEQEKPVAAAPYLDDQPAPIVPTPEYIQPVSIPQPPELPAFVMPEFPVQLVEQDKPVAGAPYLDDQPGPVVTIPEYIQPVSIPQPPELPAFVMPEFPVQLVEQEKPVAAAPCLDDQPGPVVTIPEFIPPQPSLPKASKSPEFPVHLETSTGPVIPPMNIPSPPIFFEQPKEPCFTEEIVVPNPEPIIIPEAPKLPELVTRDFPLKFSIDEPAIPQPTLVGEPCESSGKPVVQIVTMPNSYFERNFPSYPIFLSITKRS